MPVCVFIGKCTDLELDEDNKVSTEIIGLTLDINAVISFSFVSRLLHLMHLHLSVTNYYVVLIG